MEESGGTSAYRPSNPCVVVQEAVKAMLRCFGLETAADPCPPSTAQASDTLSSAMAELDPSSKPSNTIEADDPPTTGEVENDPATLEASALRKPSIDRGSGPQTN